MGAKSGAALAVPEIVVPLVGSAPLQPIILKDYEKRALDQFQKAISTAFIGNKNPMWNDAEELQVMKSVGIRTGTTTSPVININDRFSKRHPVADLNIPRNPLAVIQLSLRYAYENPFVAKATRVKTEFACKNFQHETHSASAKKFFDDYATRLRIKVQLPKIYWLLNTVGICPVYWGGEDGGPIKFLQVLDPRMVQIEEIFGEYKMWIRISVDMIDAVKDPQGKMHPRNKALYESMPAYWIQQIEECIRRGDAIGFIELKEGSYTVIDSRYAAMNRSVNTLDGVPLQPIFDSLQRYRLLAAGDFAVAWNVKNMLTLISEGDPKIDPKNYIPADNVRLGKLQSQFSNPDLALTVYCDPTTQVRYVVPPLEVFDPKKYSQVEKEIKEALNLPSFMWNTDGGGTFGAATAELKLLREEIDSLRLAVEEQFFRPLYTRLRTGATKPGFASNVVPMPSYDNNSLRDDAVWLQANSDLYAKGGLSLRSLMEVFGYDYDYEEAELKKEHEQANTNIKDRENPTHMAPLYEPSQGGQKDAESRGGRPAKPATSKQPQGDTPRNPRSKGT